MDGDDVMKKRVKLLSCVFGLLFFLSVVTAMIVFASQPLAPGKNCWDAAPGENVLVEYIPLIAKYEGLDVDAKDRLYLHSNDYTLCFDAAGQYRGTILHQDDGRIQAKAEGDVLTVYNFRANRKTMISTDGIFMEEAPDHTSKMFVLSPTVTDSKGTIYQLNHFKVISSDGKTVFSVSPAPIVLICLIAVFFLLFASVLLVYFCKDQRERKKQIVL